MKKIKHSGQIMCQIKYKDSGLLKGFLNGRTFNSIFEFRAYFLDFLQNLFPEISYQDGKIVLTYDNISYIEFKEKIYQINNYIREYNKILKDLGVEGVLPLISEECWNLLSKTEKELTNTNFKLKSTEDKLINTQNKLINTEVKLEDTKNNLLEKIDLLKKEIDDLKNK